MVAMAVPVTPMVSLARDLCGHQLAFVVCRDQVPVAAVAVAAQATAVAAKVEMAEQVVLDQMAQLLQLMVLAAEAAVQLMQRELPAAAVATEDQRFS